MIGYRLNSMLIGMLVLAGSYGSAVAQETGGVHINGSVTSATTVKGAQNIARGTNARAFSSIGSIHSGIVVDGHLNLNVDASNVTNFADGVNETAITSIGSVHKGAKATGEVVVHTGDVSNVSNGPGEVSCVIIGSKGHIPECDQ